MISAAELKVQIASTKQFIEADVELIQFNHPTLRVRTPGGGYTEDPSVSTISTPQRVRLIPQSDKVPVSADTNGTRERPEYIVAGLPDAEFRKGDTFDWRGQTWKVVQMHDKPDYIRKGDVILHRG